MQASDIMTRPVITVGPRATIREIAAILLGRRISEELATQAWWRADSNALVQIPQDARKPFAGERETAMHTGARFKGDRALYEKTLRERAATQDEYGMLAR